MLHDPPLLETCFCVLSRGMNLTTVSVHTCSTKLGQNWSSVCQQPDLTWDERCTRQIATVHLHQHFDRAPKKPQSLPCSPAHSHSGTPILTCQHVCSYWCSVRWMCKSHPQTGISFKNQPDFILIQVRPPAQLTYYGAGKWMGWGRSQGPDLSWHSWLRSG